jgi:hypothetical protein
MSAYALKIFVGLPQQEDNISHIGRPKPLSFLSPRHIASKISAIRQPFSLWPRKTRPINGISDTTYERSKPAPECIACSSFSWSTSSLLYLGSFIQMECQCSVKNVRTGGLIRTLSRLTHVLAVGKHCSSLPASWITKFGTNSLKPL